MAPLPSLDAPHPCRLLLDGSDSGGVQMAIDELLLDSAAAEGCSWLRFYNWSEPTLSLGYFQNYADRQSHPASSGCACVRRLTGGGAILHDRELTYSLAIPRDSPLAQDTQRLYHQVHEALVQALSTFGVAAGRRTEDDGPASTPEPFLCFLRKSESDVLVAGSKVCGSAQRRRQGAILQHGSLLLAQSDKAPELPGIRELAGTALDAAAVAKRWSQELGASLRLALEPQALSAARRQAAAALAEQKYQAGRWTRRR